MKQYNYKNLSNHQKLQLHTIIAKQNHVVCYSKIVQAWIPLLCSVQ